MNNAAVAFLLLKFFRILAVTLTICWVQERLGLNPNCWSTRIFFSVIWYFSSFSIIFSNILLKGESKLIGLYDLGLHILSFFFNSGVTTAIFQQSGKYPMLDAAFSMLAKYIDILKGRVLRI